jgi:hypothetical protein
MAVRAGMAPRLSCDQGARAPLRQRPGQSLPSRPPSGGACASPMAHQLLARPGAALRAARPPAFFEPAWPDWRSMVSVWLSGTGPKFSREIYEHTPTPALRRLPPVPRPALPRGSRPRRGQTSAKLGPAAPSWPCRPCSCDPAWQRQKASRAFDRQSGHPSLDRAEMRPHSAIARP